jgi:putative transcriptional regulator
MKKNDFEGLKTSMREAIEISAGKRKAAWKHRVNVPDTVDVKAIRQKLGMTQRDFSETFGFPVRSIASWEGGERTPEKAARILLTIISKKPKVVLQYAG